MTLRLPDISEFQAGANIAGILKQTGGALIIRVGYGYGHKDYKFAAFRAAAQKAKVKSLGIYQYVRADQNVTTQANQFCSWIGKRAANEWLIIDLEEGSGNQLSRANTWISVVSKKLGGFIAVYSGNAFISAHGLTSLFKDGKDWVASYGAKPTQPWMLHQYSDGQYSPRINWKGAGYCDTNEFRTTLADFVNLTTGVAPLVKKEDDDMPFVISLQCTSQKVQKGVPTWVWWNKENSDSQKQHSSNYPGILTTAKFCEVNAKVTGVNGTYYFVAVNQKTKKERSVDVGTHARNELATVVDALYANEHLYLKFIPEDDGVIAAWTKGLYWK